MRESVAAYVAGDAQKADTAEMLLGEATPNVISNVFFGMCRQAGDFDAAERKVASTLRSEVSSIIERRNDIAHGDWWVGMMTNVDDDGMLRRGPLRTLDPRLIRIRPARSEGPRKTLDLAVQDLDSMTDDIQRVIAYVAGFGRLALGLPMFCREAEKAIVTDFRVRDVFVVKGGAKGAAPAQVVPEGPHADAVILIDY